MSKGENRSELMYLKHLQAQKHGEPEFELLDRQGIVKSTDLFGLLMSLKQGFAMWRLVIANTYKVLTMLQVCSNQWMIADSFSSHNGSMKWVLLLSQFYR